MLPSIGIDLGTTACRVAHLVGSEPRIIPNRRRRPDTPSYVGVAVNGQVVVGEEVETLAAPPLMGLKQMLGSQQRLWLGGVMRTPAELVALLLRALKEDAERWLGASVEGAVVSVPAGAGNLPRVALRQAAAAAGLRSVRLINEPTAAALACLEPSDRPRRVLVYSLGAGTFESVVFEVEGRQFKSLAMGNQEGIGGQAFDTQIADYLLNRLEAARLGVRPPWDVDTLFSVCRSVEAAKIRLSETTETIVVLPQLASADSSTPLEAPLSRDEVSALLRPAVQATMRVVHKMLDDTRLTPADLDTVLLVGGSTRLWLVQESINELTRQEFRLAPLDSAVRGAALQTVTLGELAQPEAGAMKPSQGQPPGPPVKIGGAALTIRSSIPTAPQSTVAPQLPAASLAECLDWLERGDLDRAIDGLRILYQQQATTEVRGYLVRAYHGKGLKLQAARKWQQAEKVLTEALRHNPADHSTRQLLGQICLTWGNKLIENGDRRQGQQILERGLGYDPDRVDLAQRLQELKTARSGKPSAKGKRNAKR